MSKKGYRVTNTKTVKYQSVPWSKLFKKSIHYLTDQNQRMLIFLGLFFVFAFPAQFDFPEWKDFSPLHLWLWGTGALCVFAASYFNTISFILWISAREEGSDPKSLRKTIQVSASLMVPLSLLSIRGAFLTLFGAFLLIIPGVYFALKYEIASLSLVLEGWKDRDPPLSRARGFIRNTELRALLLLGFVMIADQIFALLLDGALKLLHIEPNFLIRCGLAAVESIVTVICNIYMTLLVIFMFKNTPHQNH